MPVPSNPQDLINIIREKLFNNTSGLIEEPDLREVLENIVKVLDAKFSMFSPNLTEEQFAQWNLILDYMAKETKGVLSPTSPAPTEKGKYLLSSAGTYANLGGLVAAADKLNYAYFDGTTWSLIAVDMPKGEDGKTIESWTAKSYLAGSQVFYDGKIFEANANVIATDVPSESNVWNVVLQSGSRSILLDTDKHIKNAFLGMELKGLWRGLGLWVQTIAFNTINNLLDLVIRDKNNNNVFEISGFDVSGGKKEIPINSLLFNGTLYVDFTNISTFQQVVNFPINEGYIVDLNNEIISDDFYRPFTEIPTTIELSNKILVVDNTIVDDAGYSVTAPIAVSDGMQIAYVGNNSSNSQYFDVAHIYNEFGAVVQKINQSGTTGNFQFEVTSNDASYMRVVVENSSISNFKLILKNSVEKVSLPSYETIPAPLISGKAVAFDGTIVDAGYSVTDFVKVNPNSIIGYNGFLTLVYSVALYDANKRFIKSVLRPTGTEPNVTEGQFTTTRDTMYVRASVSNNRFFRLFYIIKDASNTFPTVMQGYKNGSDFKLENGISFQKIKPTLDTWEDAIEMNGTKRLSNNFVITNRNYFILQNAASKELRAITKRSPIYGVSVSGDTHTISLSEDSGITYTDLFTITDSKINEILVHSIQNANGVLFLRARMKPSSVSYAEEIILRCEKVNGAWDIDEVLSVPYTDSNSYATFEFNGGFSFHKNIVVVNDYGSQGVVGRLWVSQDFGKTFTKVLDIYQPPHSTYINNGHIHGSSYDPVFNRIWVSTGDGYTNTYVLWSDDLGATWNRTQVGFKDENGDSHIHTQFVGIMAFSDFVLFNHDSPRSGVYRYNRGKKEDTPIIEWVADITDHSKNEIALPTQYSGVSMTYNDGVYYVACGWHDAGVAATGVLGKILVSKDGYNWEVFYQDTIDQTTGFGYLGSQSFLLVNDKNVMFRTKVDGAEWMILDKPIFK